MKYLVTFLTLFFSLSLPSANLYGGGPLRITAQELKAMMDRGEEITMIDVRTPEEYNDEHIPGSILIPLNTIPGLKEFPYQGRVVLYCTAGVRSNRARKILEGKGVKGVIDLEGGIEAWKKVGGKVVTPLKPSSWYRDDGLPIISGYPRSFQVPKGVCEQGLDPSLVISK